MKIQENITQLRKSFQVTQKQLSDALGVSYQTISKWENGVTLPDITLLADIAKFFHITTDQLLGVMPLETTSYTPRDKTTSGYRDKNIQQFEASRALYWNEDYLKYMIEHVWSIKQAVNVAEIGAGTGIFSRQLLKYLPPGSTYTGYESSKAMILYGQDQYKVHLKELKDFPMASSKYDMIICQGYLRHTNTPVKHIETYLRRLRKGGIFIAHEENRPFEISGLLLGDLKDDSFQKGVLLEKMWSTERDKEGRDYRVGLRLPLLLKAAGLNKIQARLNDRIDLILNQNQPLLDLLNDHYRLTSITEDQFFDFLLERGLNQQEAMSYIDMYHARKNYMNQSIENIQLVHTTGLIIGWGKS